MLLHRRPFLVCGMGACAVSGARFPLAGPPAVAGFTCLSCPTRSGKSPPMLAGRRQAAWVLRVCTFPIRPAWKIDGVSTSLPAGSSWRHSRCGNRFSLPCLGDIKGRPASRPSSNSTRSSIKTLLGAGTTMINLFLFLHVVIPRAVIKFPLLKSSLGCVGRPSCPSNFCKADFVSRKPQKPSNRRSLGGASTPKEHLADDHSWNLGMAHDHWEQGDWPAEPSSQVSSVA